MEANACEFCNEFSGGRENSFSARYAGLIENRTIYGTQSFRVLPSLGQIVEGHVLVVPTAHYLAFADLPADASSKLKDDLVPRLKNALAAVYGPSILFEHGTRSNESGGCGIYHAHLHAVPMTDERDVTARLKRRFSYKLVDDIREISKGRAGGTSYLYYEDLQSNRYVFSVHRLPSQYMRRLLAEVLGREGWDWRKAGLEPGLTMTIARLFPLMARLGGELEVKRVRA